MKRLAIPIILILLVVGLYYLQADEDRFSQYQSRRNPAGTSTPQVSVKKAKEPLKKLASSHDTSKVKPNKKRMRRNYHQLKPLDSRKIAAQSSKEANHWQDVETNPLWVQGEEYLVSKNIFAVDKREFDQNDPRIKGEFLGHYLLAADTAPNDSFPVLIHKESSKYAILTKVLKVKLKKFEDMNYLFDFPHQVQESFENISVVLYKFDEIDSLTQAYQVAKNDPRVRRVTIEILKGARVNQ